ncbi:MAG: hypothetical protein IKX63_02020, partial [Muribaculaceae bacterium]|nr:hypothetical protein [Muribaculaceae bacterium]
ETFSYHFCFYVANRFNATKLVIIIVITKKKRGDIFVYLLRGIAKRPTRNKQSIPRPALISSP